MENQAMMKVEKETKKVVISSNGKNHVSNLTVNLNGASLKNRSYDISFGNLQELGKRLYDLKAMPRKLVVVTNKVIFELHGNRLLNSLKKHGFEVLTTLIQDGEKYKSEKTYLKIIEELVSFKDEENIGIVSFGGGVVGDISGFVAGTFNRGVPYVQVPTTLLGQVDCAVGGKVGINWTNVNGGKNLVGLIYQPVHVFIDISLLDTLPKRELISGLAEVIKYGFIKDRDFLEYLKENCNNALSLDKETMRHIVKRCCEIKKEIVEKDERDDVSKGIRALLNFGHTFGHALEAATSYKKYKHGEAISIGMVCAANLSQELDLITKDEVQEVIQILSSYGLPATCNYKSMDTLIKHMKLDKKFTGGKTRFVVLKKLGEATLCEDISWQMVKKVYHNVLK